jgi:hypothetical protein
MKFRLWNTATAEPWTGRLAAPHSERTLHVDGKRSSNVIACITHALPESDVNRHPHASVGPNNLDVDMGSSATNKQSESTNVHSNEAALNMAFSSLMANVIYAYMTLISCCKIRINSHSAS